MQTRSLMHALYSATSLVSPTHSRRGRRRHREMTTSSGGGTEADGQRELHAGKFALSFGRALELVLRCRGLDSFDIQVAARTGPDASPPLLRVSLPGLGRERAELMVSEARRICPYAVAAQALLAVDLVEAGELF